VRANKYELQVLLVISLGPSYCVRMSCFQIYELNQDVYENVYIGKFSSN